MLTILLSTSTFICFATTERDFVFVNKYLNWTGAQAYCRERYVDLVTVYDHQENQKLITLAQNLNECVWIGLYHKLDNWRWSMGVPSGSVQYKDDVWSKRQSDNTQGNQHCARMSRSSAGVLDKECTNKHFFICFNGKSGKKHIIVHQAMTWWDAQAHCRQHYDDLASVAGDDVTQVLLLLMQSLSVGDAWIGLYRDPWSVWSDNGNTSFYYWDQEPLLHQTNDHCGCLSASTGKWNQNLCSNSKPFFCYRVNTNVRKKTVLKVKLQSEVDLNSRDIQHQIVEQMKDMLGSIAEANVTMKWKATKKMINP